jgi:hypothetical protein
MILSGNFATGVRSYYARFGRNRRFALGKVGTLRPDEARERCQKVLGNVAHGRHPMHGLGGDGLTLGQFIDETYAPWVKANRPRGAINTLGKLYRLYGSWFAEPLSTITIERIESWKIRRLHTGRTATTVLRADLMALEHFRIETSSVIKHQNVKRHPHPRANSRKGSGIYAALRRLSACDKSQVD